MKMQVVNTKKCQSCRENKFPSSVSPVDYGDMDTLLSFAECQMRSCVNVSIVEDTVLENVESFVVTLERVPELDSRITLDPVEGFVEITDNDGMYNKTETLLHMCPSSEAMVGLESTLYTVSEDEGLVEVCAVVYSPSGDCPITYPFNVVLSTEDGIEPNRAGMYVSLVGSTPTSIMFIDTRHSLTAS